MKKQIIQILILSILIVGCNKDNALQNTDLPNEKDKKVQLQKQINNFSNFLDKKIKSTNSAKSVTSQTTPAQFVDAINTYVQTQLVDAEPQYFWMQENIDLQTYNMSDNLVHLTESMTDLEVVQLLETNLYSTINFSNTLSINSPAMKANLNSLEESLVDAIKDDVINAYLLDDDNMTEAQSELLAEQANEILKTKTKIVLENKTQSISIFPQGLTPEQANIFSISIMASVVTLDDLNLMENLDGVVNGDVFSGPSIPDEPEILAKGLFGKIGKFFGKVIKSVAVVVASAAIIVGGAVLGYLNNHAYTNSNNNNSNNSDYTALTGALVGVGIVSKNSKKWWSWVGWNRL